MPDFHALGAPLLASLQQACQHAAGQMLTLLLLVPALPISRPLLIVLPGPRYCLLASPLQMLLALW